MSNQVIPFPQRVVREVPKRETSAEPQLRAKLVSRLTTARGVVRAVIDTLSYLGDARVKPPLAPVTSLRAAK
jgi:hypothetical protein